MIRKPWVKSEPQPILLPEPRRMSLHTARTIAIDPARCPTIYPSHSRNGICFACGTSCGSSDIFCGQCGKRLTF